MSTLIIFFASYLPYVLVVTLVIFALWPRPRLRMAITAFISGGTALVIKKIIVQFIHRPRPYVALSSVHNIIGPQTGEEYQSFPSGHALFFFAVAMAIYMYDRRLGWWFFAGATLISVARVAGGIHWSTDIMAGAALGILTAWAIVRIIPALRPHALEKTS